MADLTHIDDEGRVSMVDITDKSSSRREARARALVKFPPGVLSEILEQGLEKGDLFAVARVAGIQGAKQTPQQIPLGHPIDLSHVEVEIFPKAEENLLKIEVTARTRDATGVEMEALNGAATAALTIYDMCKATAKEIEIESVKLLNKSGGASGDWRAPDVEESQ